MVKKFPTSLREGALNWFTQLPPNSVDNFKALAVKFITQCATSRPHHMSSLALLNFRQGKGNLCGRSWKDLTSYL